jgi:hypothetical protein
MACRKDHGLQTDPGASAPGQDDVENGKWRASEDEDGNTYILVVKTAT